MRSFLVFFIFFVSCTVGPKYKRPEVRVSSSYVEGKGLYDKAGSISNWWEIFEDESLNELIKIAILNNHDLKIACERMEEARAFYRIKRADIFPKVDATAAAIRAGVTKNLTLTSLMPNKTFNFFDVGFDAVWEVDIFGKLRKEKEAAYHNIEAAREMMRDVYVSLVGEVARNYVDIASIKRYISLTKEKILLEEEVLEIVSKREAGGISSGMEKERALYSLERERENLFLYTSLLKDSIYKLALLLGKQSDEMGGYVGSAKMIDGKRRVSVGLPSTLLRRRADIRRAERELLAKNAELGSKIADYFPSFSLVGSSIFISNFFKKLFSGDSFTWIVGSIMNWPVINFGKTQAAVDMAESKKRSAVLTYEKTVLGAFLDVESALASYFYEEKRFEDVKRALGAKGAVLELEFSKFQNGLIDFESYLKVRKSYLQDKVDYISSKRALATNLIALYKALGGGDWESK